LERQLTNAQRQRFSKFKQIVKAIDGRIAGGETKDASLAFFDSVWSSMEVNKNETKMISKLQKDGLLKLNARKWKAPEEMARARQRSQHQAGSAGAPLRPGPLLLLNQNSQGQVVGPPTNVLNPNRIV